MKLSIIIPVFNAQAYIDRCVKSILSQDFKDFELLLINDGSTDRSLEIIKSYSDKRIRVITKNNSGVSRTRNLGIDEAKGEYIQFVDRDDWLTTDSSGLMVSMADESGADMVISDFYRVVSNRVSQKGDIDEGGIVSLDYYAENMMMTPADYYYGVLWNKLYRKDILDKYNLRMNPDISWCEDFLFNLEYLMHCKNIYVLKAPVYYYVKREGSLVNRGAGIQRTVQMKQTVFGYYQNFYKKILSQEDYEKNKLYIYKFLGDGARDGIVFPRIMPGSYKLGKERVNIFGEPTSEDGVYAQLYYMKRLFERELESAALKNSITLPMAQILYCIKKINNIHSVADFREVAGIPHADIFVSIQKLSVMGYISVSEMKQDDPEEKKYKFTINSRAESVMRDILEAEGKYKKLMGTKGIYEK